MTPTSPEEIVERADAMLRQKYVVRADARQAEIGLSYIEAETSEMARTIARFAEDALREATSRIAELEQVVDGLASGAIRTLTVVTLEKALRPFAFLDHPEKFQSTEGGCTDVTVADEQVQAARAALIFKEPPLEPLPAASPEEIVERLRAATSPGFARSDMPDMPSDASIGLVNEAADLIAALTKPPEGLVLETTEDERSLWALKGRFNYALDETGAVDWSPLPRLIRDIATLTARLAGVEPWECKGRDSGPGGNPPGDCNWPVCGCDPHASKVIDALEESGAFVTANELAAERTAREAAEDALREARTMAALSPETQTGAALHRAEAALATLREKVRVLGEFAEATTEPNMVGVPAMVLTEALAALLAPSGNGEGTADG